MREGEHERRQRFNALFASYSSDIVAYCGWRAASASDAQDAAAEVFLIAWRRLDELPEGDGARVWLYATARKVLANQRRSSRRQAALRERLARNGSPVVQEPSPSGGEELLVHEALRRLRPRDREVLLLSEWEDLSPAQIAVVLGCGAMTARGRLTDVPAKEEQAMSGSIQALRRANPRTRDGFAESVEATAEALSARLAATAADVPVETGAPGRDPGHSAPRRRLGRASTVGTLVATAAAVAVFLTVGGPGTGPGVANAAAAVRKAATVTAAPAERSGTAVVRIDHNGEFWVGTTVRWHGQDMAKEDMAAPRDVPRRPGKVGSRFLLVDGTMYGVDPEDGGWVVLGSPDSIDPDSGTTPDEYLAAVREDVDGTTLRRITDGMTGLTTRQLDDGSTVYSGSVAAGLIARETGFKEGQSIRVLPFGYVAHDEAANPEAPLQVAVTVGTNGVVREIAVTWGSGTSEWTYRVAYSGLGATPAPTAPANATPLRRVLRDEARTGTGGSR